MDLKRYARKLKLSVTSGKATQGGGGETPEGWSDTRRVEITGSDLSLCLV